MKRIVESEESEIINALQNNKKLTTREELMWEGPIKVGYNTRTLCYAAERGMLEAIAVLLASPQMHINREDDDRFALWLAVFNNHIEAVKLLLKNPRIINDHLTDALCSAAANGRMEILELLMSDPRADSALAPGVDGESPLTSAIRDKQLAMVKRLLKDPRVDPAAVNNTAIFCAVNGGNIDIVKLLLADSRVNPADQDNYAILIAAKCGRMNILELLLADPRVNPADHNNRAILGAAQKGHAAVIKRLLCYPQVITALSIDSRNRENLLLGLPQEAREELHIVAPLLSVITSKEKELLGRSKLLSKDPQALQQQYEMEKLWLENKGRTATELNNLKAAAYTSYIKNIRLTCRLPLPMFLSCGLPQELSELIITMTINIEFDAKFLFGAFCLKHTPTQTTQPAILIERLILQDMAYSKERTITAKQVE